MTFKDQMAADMTSVFLNADEFADAATITPIGSESSGSLTVLFGDHAPTFPGNEAGTELRTQAPVIASLTAWRALMESLTGTARNPRRGDQIAVATGANAGTWVVESSAPDVGDGVRLDAIRASAFAPGGQGVRRL